MAYSIQVPLLDSVYKTQVLSLVFVPDVRMNLLNVFVGTLLCSVVFAARCVVSSGSALIFVRKSSEKYSGLK